MKLNLYISKIVKLEQLSTHFIKYVTNHYDNDYIDNHLIIYTGSLRSGLQERSDFIVKIIPNDTVQCGLNYNNLKYKISTLKYTVEDFLTGEGTFSLNESDIINSIDIQSLSYSSSYFLYNTTLKNIISDETYFTYKSIILNEQAGPCPCPAPNLICSNWGGGPCGCYAKGSGAIPCQSPTPAPAPTPVPLQNCSQATTEQDCIDTSKYKCGTGPGPAPTPCSGGDCSNSLYISITASSKCQFDTAKKVCCCANSSSSCPTPAPTPISTDGPPFYGGWAMGKDTWDPNWDGAEGSNTILIGPFNNPDNKAGVAAQREVATALCKRQYKNIFYTMGGAGVNNPLGTTIENSPFFSLFQEWQKVCPNINGLCFDAEASLNGQQAYNWLKAHKADFIKKYANGKKFYFIIVADFLDNVTNDGTFDYLAIMSYIGNPSYPPYDQTLYGVQDGAGAQALGQFVTLLTGDKDKGTGTIYSPSGPAIAWPVSKLILAYQSVSLKHGNVCKNQVSGQCKCTKDGDSNVGTCTAPDYSNRQKFITWMGNLLKKGGQSILPKYRGGNGKTEQMTLTGPFAGIFGWNAQFCITPGFPHGLQVPSIDKENWQAIKTVAGI